MQTGSPLVLQLVAQGEAANVEPQLGLQLGEEAAVEVVNPMQEGLQDFQLPERGGAGGYRRAF